MILTITHSLQVDLNVRLVPGLGIECALDFDSIRCTIFDADPLLLGNSAQGNDVSNDQLDRDVAAGIEW
jgi:hypothetical protein